MDGASLKPHEQYQTSSLHYDEQFATIEAINIQMHREIKRSFSAQAIMSGDLQFPS